MAIPRSVGKVLKDDQQGKKEVCYKWDCYPNANLIKKKENQRQGA